ncbi:hypothetical protein GCM10010339_53860 [Streptomyces alanosinicus]|uniref:Uncharacterized protein n=1 Tax=Streptomyces alanosinicus TaxID=68171 RepID=A0A918YLZ5_9ACTN|nr:hypothetical protein GCM10010339_53860 [Streptomyces alanosinicus]
MRRAMREPGPVAPFAGFTAGAGEAPELPDPVEAVGDDTPGRPLRGPPSPDAAGPGFWACWGEELPFTGPVPLCDSGSAEALPSLLKRPCTSVATSGPGAPPRERRDTVSALWSAP